MDCLRIKNLKIPARHGVYSFEKQKDGVFELDAELFLNLRTAGKTDDLSKTINYAEVVELITNIFTSEDCKLVESVAEKISEKLLSEFNIDRVKIRIRKPHAPISADFDTVEVEIDRKR